LRPDRVRLSVRGVGLSIRPRPVRQHLFFNLPEPPLRPVRVPASRTRSRAIYPSPQPPSTLFFNFPPPSRKRHVPVQRKWTNTQTGLACQQPWPNFSSPSAKLPGFIIKKQQIRSPRLCPSPQNGPGRDQPAPRTGFPDRQPAFWPGPCKISRQGGKLCRTGPTFRTMGGLRAAAGHDIGQRPTGRGPLACARWAIPAAPGDKDGAYGIDLDRPYWA